MYDETRTAEVVAREILEHETYMAAEERGSRLSPERFEVQRLALGTLSITTLSVGRSAIQGASSNWQALSQAEQEVAILAAAGWPNSAIGVGRGASVRTVDAQMSALFEKLMITSRRDIARFVPDQRNQEVTERSHAPIGAGRTHEVVVSGCTEGRGMS